MNRIFIFLVGIVTIGVVAAMVRATSSESSSVHLVSELARNPKQEFIRIRVGGRVAARPISYEVEPAFKLSFSIQDRPGENGEALLGEVPVVYEGIKPDMFEVGRDVLVDGDFKNGTFYAAQLLTQCPSKYEPPKEPSTHE